MWRKVGRKNFFPDNVKEKGNINTKNFIEDAGKGCLRQLVGGLL